MIEFACSKKNSDCLSSADYFFALVPNEIGTIATHSNGLK